jgi:hypothetical protein
LKAASARLRASNPTISYVLFGRQADLGRQVEELLANMPQLLDCDHSTVFWDVRSNGQ